MAKVTKRVDTVSLFDMKDGEVAEIIKWHDPHVSVGTIIQKYGDAAILIGEVKGRCYPNIFESEDESLEDIKVRILPKGTVITL